MSTWFCYLHIVLILLLLLLLPQHYWDILHITYQVILLSVSLSPTSCLSFGHFIGLLGQSLDCGA